MFIIKLLFSLTKMQNEEGKSKPKRRIMHKRHKIELVKSIEQFSVDNQIQKLIVALCKEPYTRSNSDLARIKFFLENSDLASKFKADNLNSDSLDKMLSMCSTAMRHCKLEKNKILFRIGDKGDNFYLIVSGKIEILKPIPIKTSITGLEYYRHIMKLYQTDEHYIMNLTLEANKKIVPIDVKDLPELNLIILKIILEEHFARTQFAERTIEEILILCCVDIKFFDFEIDNDLYKKDKIYHSKIESKVMRALPKIDKKMIEKYRFISSNSFKLQITLYEYKCFLDMTNGCFFGDCALDKETTRNATIKTTEDTHFCYLDYDNYNLYLKIEKQRLTAKEISFLIDSFIFRNIPFGIFEKKIFNLFIFEEKIKDEIIIKENEEVNYLYFIKDGDIELSVNKNLIELYNIGTYISKLNFPKAKGTRSIQKYPTINQKTIGLIEEKIKSKLFFLTTKETMGLESFFFGLNYLYTAKVVSEKAKYYKMERNTLLRILQEENDCFMKYEKVSSRKMEIFLNRIIDLYETRVNMNEQEIEDISHKIYNYQFKEKNNVNCKLYLSQTLREKKEERRIKNASMQLSPKVSNNFLLTLQQRDQFNSLRQSNKFVNREISKEDNSKLKYPLITTIKPKKQKTLSMISNQTVYSLRVENKILNKIRNELRNDKYLINRALCDNSSKEKENCKTYQSKENSTQSIEKKKDKVNLTALKSKKYDHPYRSKVTIEKLNKYSIFDTCNNLYSTTSNTNKGDNFTLRNNTRYLTLSNSQKQKEY